MKVEYESFLSNSIKKINTSAIREIFQLASKLEDPIDFSIGQPDFPVPQQIKEALYKAIKDNKTNYTLTQGIPELREAYSEKIEKHNGFTCNPDSLIITAGVASGFYLLFSCLIEPGDEVILVEPYFLTYPSLLEVYGARIHYVNENFEKEDLEKLKPDKKFKFIIFSHPSNPTGKIFTEEQIKNLAEFADKNGTIIISDEIYELYDYDKTFKSVGSIYKNTISMFGFSKSYNMTGLRLAAVAGPREIISKLITLQQYTIVCAPSIVQWAGIEALKLDMSKYIENYKVNRDRIYLTLKEMEKTGKIKFQNPGGAFYFFIYLNTEEEGNEFVKRAIDEKKLMLVPGSVFTRESKSFRLSYACSEETVIRGLKALEEILS
jgi:aminotransferase